MLKKRALLWLTLLLGVAFVAWKLYDNKKRLAAETELSKISRAFVPVEVTTPLRETVSATLEADGIFLPAKEMFVISETQGRVLAVYKNKGDWFDEGEIIAKVDDELLRAELDVTQANLAKLRTDRERLGRLIEGEAAPKTKAEDIDLAIQAAEAKEKVLKKQIANTSIRAPMSGTMGIRIIERGSVIGPGIQVAQMTNLDRLYLMVKVTERDILGVKKGQPVEVRVDILSGQVLQGKVTNIGLRADNTFNYDVEIEVPNPKGSPLRGGMHAKAKFASATRHEGLTLPRRAIAGSLQDPKVFVVVQDSLAALRPITLGATLGDRVEVTGGVQESDPVVLTGQINLEDGARVEVVKTHLAGQ